MEKWLLIWFRSPWSMRHGLLLSLAGVCCTRPTKETTLPYASTMNSLVGEKDHGCFFWYQGSLRSLHGTMAGQCNAKLSNMARFFGLKLFPPPRTREYKSLSVQFHLQIPEQWVEALMIMMIGFYFSFQLRKYFWQFFWQCRASQLLEELLSVQSRRDD